MIKLFDMPLFNIKKTKKYCIVSGGGGNISYGVDNGIVITEDDDTEYNFKTKDVVRVLEVYDIDDMGNQLDFMIKKEGFYSSSSSISSMGLLELSESNEEMSLNESETIISKKEAETKEAETKEKENNEGEPKGLLIAACCEDLFYLLSFKNDKFNLICEMEIGVKTFSLAKEIIILSNKGQIYGFTDLYNKNFSLNSTDISMCNNLPTDKKTMVYKIRKNGKYLVFINDEGNNVIPADLNNFYVEDGRLYRISYKNGKTNFQINKDIPEVIENGEDNFPDDLLKNKDVYIEGEIKKIIYKNKTLIYYTNGRIKSNIYINSNKDSIPKITGISTEKEFVLCCTVTGEIFLFKNGKRFYSIKISDIPLTGIDVYKFRIHYSLLSGKVGEEMLMGKKYVYYIFYLLLVMFLAIGIRFVGNNFFNAKK